MYIRNVKRKKKMVVGEAETCIIYTRVSSKEQVENFSLDSQEKICKEYANQHKLKILKVFREEGESAKTADREQLQLLLQFCNKHKWKVGRVLVYKTDRMARNMDDFSAVRLILERAGTLITAVTEPNDESDYGRFVQNMFANFAELDNRMRAQRTITGMKAKLLAGEWCWPAPLGYLNSTDKTGHKIIIVDEDKSSLVQWLFDEYVKGCYTFRQLAEASFKKGLRSRTGGKLTYQKIQEILEKPFYCGRIEKPSWDVSVEGKHVPLITEKLFFEVREVMDGGNTRRMLRNRDNTNFPLRGMICGGCGGHMSAGRSKGRYKYYPYYSCIKKDCPLRHSIPKEDFENEFTEFLKQLAPEHEFTKALREAIHIARNRDMKMSDHVQEKLQQQLEHHKDDKQKLIRLKLDSMLSDDDFKEQMDMNTLNIKKLEIELAGIETTALTPIDAIEAGLKLLRDLPDTWREIDVADFRVLRQQIFPENVVYTYPGFKTAKLSPIYKLSQEFRLDKNCLVSLLVIEPKLNIDP